MKLRRTLILLPLVALTGLAGAARGEDTPKKYRLTEATPAVGDVESEETVGNFEMKIEIKIPGLDQAPPPAMVSNREREKYTETVIAVDKDGPTHFRRTYAISRKQDGNGSAPAKLVVAGRQGKTLTFKRTGKTWTVTPDKGTLPAAEVQELKKRVAEGHTAPKFFPDHEVGVGDEWNIDTKELASAFSGLEKGTVTAKFEEVLQYQGHPCARVSVKMDMQGKAGPAPFTMLLTGDLYHALDLQHTLNVKFSGPATIPSTEQEANGQKFTMQGTGTGEFNYSSQWLKRAGKPVAAVKPAGG